MQRSIKFYEDVFHFQIRNSSDPHWTEFETGTTALALHLSPKSEGAVPITEIKAGSSGPAWFVPNIQDFHDNAVKHGAKVLHHPEKQSWGGIKAAYLDPDGTVNSVVESHF